MWGMPVVQRPGVGKCLLYLLGTKDRNCLKQALNGKPGLLKLITNITVDFFVLKQNIMDNPVIPVLIVTGFLLVYIVALGLDLNLSIILFMFSISPVLIIWMVYRVLTSSETSSYTFKERFYEDQE